MSVEVILEKLKATEGMESDAKELEEAIKKAKANKSTDTDANGVKELKIAKAAQARILEEKKKIQDKYAELETQLDDIKSADLSEVDKSKKEIDKLTKAKIKLESDLVEVAKLSDANQREYKLDKIGNGLKFLDSVPEDMRDYAIREAFKGVEDLSNQDEVTTVLDAFVESHKGVLAADTAANGSGSSSPSKTVLTSKSPDKMTIDERAKHIRSKAVGNSII